jgi:hypothetical protein
VDFVVNPRAGPKGQRTGALQDAGANTLRPRDSRSVLECGGPPPLYWHATLLSSTPASIAESPKQFDQASDGWWILLSIHGLFQNPTMAKKINDLAIAGEPKFKSRRIINQ